MIRGRLNPVALATRVTPPQPAASASDAAQSLRVRSFNSGSSIRYFCRINAISSALILNQRTPSTGKGEKLAPSSVTVIVERRLSNVFLAIDGSYGPNTAAAVRAFKEDQAPPLRQRFQSIADDIVGIGTIKALDEQMLKLENAPKPSTGLVSEDDFGTPHDHARICTPFLDSDLGPDRLITHKATPINPLRKGRMVCIGGTNEVKYLGFENFMPDPDEDPQLALQRQIVMGRRLTSSIASHSCSDISFRSAPIDDFMQRGNGRPSKADGKINRGELRRIAMPGCRLTVAFSNSNSLATVMPFLLSLGPQIQFTSIPDSDKPNLDPAANPFSGVPVVVFSMQNVF